MVSTCALAIVLLSWIPLAQQVDICDILDANYCFYFSDSSCYIELCQCDACSPDKSDNSTEASCPSWCPHVRKNDTILNILESGSSNATASISFECDDLSSNCLQNKGYNGHCYFYEKNCEYNETIASKGKSKVARNNQKHLKQCLKFQRKCHQKYPGHFSCKQFRKRCKNLDLPKLGHVKNSTLHEESLEHCLKYQKTCAEKYPKHYACRSFRRMCKKFALPAISDNEASPKRRHKIQGIIGNSTSVVVAANETTIEKLLSL
ncbi:unnamed protein product [Caenorhabditis bovis]|uniref:Domain of unknown function DB domain-containing protein n=1 Tax=Caenorhabditis bovis TaxID=2654633 RepID=A0A8S1F4B4_9PELO|nr:unnamed protein product [Caenorhabditis bovis]